MPHTPELAEALDAHESITAEYDGVFRELYALCMRTASGQADDDIVAKYIRARLTPRA